MATVKRRKLKWHGNVTRSDLWFLVLNYHVYSKQPIFGLTQEWLRELSFSRLECGVHDRLHIYPLCGIIAPLRHGHVYIFFFFVILAEPYIGITPYCNQSDISDGTIEDKRTSLGRPKKNRSGPVG